jgi:hypothetical protein
VTASRLVVLVPSIDGRPQRACEEKLRELERRGIEVRRVPGHSAIDFGRSIIATRALSDGFDELMWIDDDIVFEPDDIERLRAHGEPLVAGLYPKKGKRELAVHVLPGTKSLTLGSGGGLVEVRFAATGFLYTRRSLYEAIARELPTCNEKFGEPVVPYFLPFVIDDPERGTWYLSEDFAFSERARRAGHRVMVDTSVRLFHVGTYGYGWEDAGAEPKRFATYDFRIT